MDWGLHGTGLWTLFAHSGCTRRPRYRHLQGVDVDSSRSVSPACRPPVFSDPHAVYITDFRNKLESILADLPRHRSFFVLNGGPLWDEVSKCPARLCLVIEVFRGTFRRCADRNPRTRRRSVLHPRGIDPAAVADDNSVAGWVAHTLRWASDLGHTAIVVHPSDSYLWPVLDSENPPPKRQR